jgi:hypothetical protein
LKGAYQDRSSITKRIQHLTLSKIMRSKLTTSTFTATAVTTHEQQNRQQHPAVAHHDQVRSLHATKTSKPLPTGGLRHEMLLLI